MEWLVLGGFCAGLFVCLIFDISILLALTMGLVLFLLYGKWKGFSWRELGGMAMTGVKSVKNILFTFVLIGMLTALWREAGTIPVIVCYASGMIRPSILLLMTFLLNCLVSVLTGTAFGTAATMGVICATMGAALGIDPVLMGGAVLAGAYFGDRCSPVSTSALLVSELTKTSIFTNIRNMIGTTGVPLLLSCAVFGVAGLMGEHTGQLPDLRGIFAREFALSWLALLPALVILTLSLLRFSVKKAMTASILTALPIALLVQDTPLKELPKLLVMGYEAADGEVAAMLNGGGIVSMIRVGAIVCIASSYSGIFQKTGLLDGAKRLIGTLSARTSSYTATLVTGIVASMIACNQSLAILLTHQLCGDIQPDEEEFALTLEDTVVVVAPLVPWSIAGAVPLTTVGAPLTALLWTCYLYLLPMWRLVAQRFWKKHR